MAAFLPSLWCLGEWTRRGLAKHTHTKGRRASEIWRDNVALPRDVRESLESKRLPRGASPQRSPWRRSLLLLLLLLHRGAHSISFPRHCSFDGRSGGRASPRGHRPWVLTGPQVNEVRPREPVWNGPPVRGRARKKNTGKREDVARDMLSEGVAGGDAEGGLGRGVSFFPATKLHQSCATFERDSGYTPDHDTPLRRRARCPKRGRKSKTPACLPSAVCLCPSLSLSLPPRAAQTYRAPAFRRTGRRR